MANEFRQTEDSKSGALINPLTNSGTSMVSSALAQLAAVDSTEHMPIILDPLGTGNGPEIAWITAHTASSTGATIVRGREGTSGVTHASTTAIAWVHGPTTADHIRRGTTADRTALTGGLPFAGQAFYDYDVDGLLIYTTATTGWRAPWNMPWGLIGYDDTSDQADQTFSAAGDITGMSLTFTALATRYYKTTVHIVSSASAGPYTNGPGIYDGSNVLKKQAVVTHHASGYWNTFNIVLVESGISGSVTRKFRHVTAASSITYAGGSTATGQYCSILVEDIGPASAPA